MATLFRVAAAARVAHARLLCASAPRLFRGPLPTQHQRRVAARVRLALSQTLSRGLVKDRQLDDGAAVHVVDVQVARGNALARVLWEPMDDARGDVRQIQSALDRKRGILRHHVNALLQQKRAIALEFIPHSGLVRPPAEIALERAFEALEHERADER